MYTSGFRLHVWDLLVLLDGVKRSWTAETPNARPSNGCGGTAAARPFLRLPYYV